MPKTVPFAILRVEKVKTFTQMAARQGHNARTSGRGTEHCDPAHGPELIAGSDDVRAAWDARAEACGTSRAGVRKNGTVALEWMATASPEWFQSATPQEVAEWAQDSLDFIAKQAGGAANVLAAHVHLDETTPHIHAITIPLVQKAVKRRGRAPKGAPTTDATAPSWRLSARDLIGGDSARLVELQDAYADEMTPHGLRRGIPRKETGARNKPPAKYRAELAALGDSLAARSEALDGQEKAIARKAAILEVVRRESGQSPSPALEAISPKTRQRPLGR